MVWRHLAQLRFPCPIHFWKHFKQKLCPHGEVTGLSGNCMQNEQFKLPSRRSRTSPSPIAFSFFLVFSLSVSFDRAAPLMRSCRLCAFSSSVSDKSASIALMAAIRSPEVSEAPAKIVPPATSGWSVEQSGHSHWRVDASVSGGTERQLTCQGVAQVLQVSVSSTGGLLRQSMQMPSPSQGSWLACSIERMGKS